MCYILSDIQAVNYLERSLPMLISIQHTETQFDLWILSASTHTPDLEARWEKDIINSARDDMYILN